jgi:hypothetical protein
MSQARPSNGGSPANNGAGGAIDLRSNARARRAQPHINSNSL